MKSIIHVNQHHIKANRKDGGNRPVFPIKQSGKTVYAQEVEQVEKDYSNLAGLYRERGRELDEARADAERYRWLRSQTWDKHGLCVVWNTTDSVKLGTDCPSHDRLDDAIDAAKEPR